MGSKKILITFFIILFISLIFFTQDDTTSKNPEKQSVVLSTFALYDIASHIAKDSFELSMVLPFGSDAHSYELSPKKMAHIQDADLFVYSGASLEPWISKFSSSDAIDMSKYVKLISLDEKHHHKHDEHKEAVDPHYWLDLENMQKMAGVLTKQFIELLPSKKEFFLANKKEYIENLKNMDERYKKELSTCKKHTIIVNHNAFSYLGKRYGFSIASISGLSNDSMPSPKDIKHVLNLIKDKYINVVFFESFASDKIIKSIAKDSGIKFNTLQPLGNITKYEQGMSYSQIMDKNIEKIKNALECK